MQVNKVQQSTNFGMALRIKPEAVKYLKEQCTRADIERLQKIAEEIKDTKFYHLEVGEDGDRVVTSHFANKYKGGSFDIKVPNDEYLKFSAKWMGTESGNLKQGDMYSSCIKFENEQAAKDAYADIRTSRHGDEEDAKMIKYLDARAVKKEQDDMAARKEKEAVGAMVDNLFEKFGVK